MVILSKENSLQPTPGIRHKKDETLSADQKGFQTKGYDYIAHTHTHMLSLNWEIIDEGNTKSALAYRWIWWQFIVSTFKPKTLHNKSYEYGIDCEKEVSLTHYQDWIHDRVGINW